MVSVGLLEKVILEQRSEINKKFVMQLLGKYRNMQR